MELIAPCHFGTEAVLKREIYRLGYEITRVENGRVFFEGDAEAVCRANIGLRTAERILWKVGDFTATSFEELFQGIRAIPWEEYLPRDARFWVTKAASVRSALFSPSDIQSVAKKAMVERMKSVWKLERFPETGEEYPVRIFLMNDEVTVTLDTTGTSLHKRGYRTLAGEAPISETLAAALIGLTPWHPDRILADPFCGSGTFLIEAARMAAHIAPGIDRSFTAERWTNLIPPEEWKSVRSEMRSLETPDVSTDLQGFDIDDDVIRVARANARAAGVDHLIHFQTRDVRDFSHSGKYGFLLTNPPYGERLEEKEDLPPLYRALGEAYRRLDSWSMYVVTSYEDAQRYIGKKADRNRKLYNGMIRTYFYQYAGPKPPKRGGRKNAGE